MAAWFSDPDLLARDGAWQATGWGALLQASPATRERMTGHGFVLPERVTVHAAGSSLLPRAAGRGWIAVGDAAASFDPLSSYGIASALAHGNRAAEAIAAALRGDSRGVSEYSERQLADFARYLWLRQAYYAAEQRWPDAPFWRRRHYGLGAPARLTVERSGHPDAGDLVVCSASG